MNIRERDSTRTLGWMLAAIPAVISVAVVLFVGWMFGIF